MERTASGRLRLLAITNEFPLPLDRGGPVRFFGLARALATGHDVHMLALRRPSTTDSLVTELAEVLGGPVEVFDWPPTSGGWVRAIRRGVPPWIAAQHSPELERRAHELVENVDAVAILDDYAAIYAPALAARVPVVCDKSNVFGWSAPRNRPDPGLSGRARQRLSASLVRRFESQYARASQGLVVTSVDEADRMRSLYGIDPGAVVPSAVDVPPEPAAVHAGGAVGWLGTHEYPANVEGLVRFVEEGWAPLGASGARLLVAGGGAPAHVLELERHPGVEILGYVDSLDEFFGRLTAAVVPLWSGAGVKLKTITFMAAGVPVVGTPVAVEGIAGTPGDDYLVAEEPEELATGIRRLLDEPQTARQMGLAGRRLVTRDYSWPAVGAQFRQEVERVAARG